MKISHQALYSLIPILIAVIGPVLRICKRDLRSLHGLDASLDILDRFPDFDNIATSSLLRTMLLRAEAGGIEPLDLERYVRERFDVDLGTLERLRSLGTSKIFACPHYGPYLCFGLLLASLATAEFRTQIFYDSPSDVPTNRHFDALLAKFSDRLRILHNEPRGIISALRGLKRGQSLGMMFDVVQQAHRALAVPFLGRLYPAMPGTAYMALRSGAPILPVYVAPGKNATVSVEFGQALLPSDFNSADADQNIYDLTCALFRDFEKQIRKAPWEWAYLSDVERVPIFDVAELLGQDGLRVEIAKRCEALPELWRLLPSLQKLNDDRSDSF